VVVKLLFNLVNYQVVKLLKSSCRSFCLPVDSYWKAFSFRGLRHLNQDGRQPKRSGGAPALGGGVGEWMW